MPIFLSQRSELIKKSAEHISERLGHFYLGCEHIFLSILDNESWLAEMLEEHGIDAGEMREQILNICGPGDENSLWKGIITTPRLKKILKIAEREAESVRAYKVEPNHIAAAICREGRSVPARVLDSLDVELPAFRKKLLDMEDSSSFKQKDIMPIPGTPYSAYMAKKGKDLPPADPSGKKEGEQQAQKDKEKEQKKKDRTPVIDKLGRDIVQMAKDGKIDPIVGRKDEIRRMLQTLTKKMKNNPIIIGEAGVGKTAVVYGLAQRIAEGKVPDAIKNKKIVELGMASIVAGTKHRGEFEERMQALINELVENPDIVVFIDEIHMIMGAGDSRGGMDAGNILKPYLARSEITVIGATTIDEYRKHIEKDPALERRFQPILVEEPTEEETIEILNGLKEKYEKHHGVIFSSKAVQAAVKMSVRYIPDRNLPDKAIDLMDEAAARSKMSYTSVATEEDLAKLSDEITEESIAEVVSLWTGIPAAKISEQESERLLHMEDHLRKRVVGQEHAVKTVAQTIRMVRMGLSSPNQPSGVFLFLGPTGVGKTELAKALAEFLFGSEKDLIRLDMSEYKEMHAMSRLIGSPPGYIGHEEEGQLTKEVRTKPYSVVLLDEVEKAHPEVFDLFLQVFDDGRLTDSKGRTVNFTNTIIIMTSNIGTKLFDASGLFDVPDLSDPAMREEVMGELKKYFRPEFLNRIDEIVIFNALDEEQLMNIVRMKITDLSAQLKKQRDITMNVDNQAVLFLMQQGFDPQFGARPMKRAIQNYLSKPFAEAMLAKGVQPGDAVSVRYNGEELTFNRSEEVETDSQASDEPELFGDNYLNKEDDEDSWDIKDAGGTSPSFKRVDFEDTKPKRSPPQITQDKYIEWTPKKKDEQAKGEQFAFTKPEPQKRTSGQKHISFEPKKKKSTDPIQGSPFDSSSRIQPQVKRSPVLRDRDPSRNIEDILPKRGPSIDPSGDNGINPEDYKDTLPRKPQQ